jgi:hypothetical protein
MRPKPRRRIEGTVEHEMQRSPEMRRHRILEILDVHVVERAHLDDAGHVEQDVNGDPLGQNPVDRLPRLVPPPDVARDRHDLHAGELFLQETFGPVQFSRVAREQTDSGPLGRQPPREDETQPARSSGDHDAPPREVDRPPRARNLDGGKRRTHAGYQSQQEFPFISHCLVSRVWASAFRLAERSTSRATPHGRSGVAFSISRRVTASRGA